MCEITTDNFDIKFQEIAYTLQKANYIAIDTEFTGLHLGSAQPSFRDSAQERYVKLKKSVQQFNVVQIGLSTFRYSNDQKLFVCDTYNFYLFPRDYGIGTESTCTLQSSGVEFLCKYQFDFNKLIYKGIPYLNNLQEKQLKAKLTSQFSGAKRDLDEEAAVERMSDQKRLELQKDGSNEIQKTIDMMLGFTKIFRLLVEFKKPLVMHNGFMDLLYLYDKFYEPLPPTVCEFKANLKVILPLIYDTKHISLKCKQTYKQAKELYESTVLENLFVSLNREISKKCALYLPSIKHSPESSSYALKSHPHEAGYDAFMCGSIFIKLAHALTTYDSKNFYNVRPSNINDYFLMMKPYEGKVHLLKASVDYINLHGQDPPPISIKMFYVQSKKPLAMFQIIKAFSSFGSVEVSFNSKYTACVAVDSMTNAANIIAAFKNDSLYQVRPYNYWIHNNYLKNSLWTTCAITAGAALLYLILPRK